MSVRIIKQKQEHIKTLNNGETISPAPVLIESTLLLMPNQHHAPIISYEQTQQPTNSLTTAADSEVNRMISTVEHSPTIPLASNTARRPISQGYRVPVQNALQWFNAPDLQHERVGRMEKVVASLVRRSGRHIPSYAYVIKLLIINVSIIF